MPVDWDGIQKIGINAFLVIAILYGCFWMLRRILDIYDKHLERMDTRQDATLTEHREERAKWMSQYEKHTEKLDKGMQYQREEHQRMMSLIQSLESRIAASSGS